MEKGKGQGRSCLARRLLVRGQGTVLKVLGLPGGLSFGQLLTVGSRQYKPPIVFVTEISFCSLFPGIFWVIRSHAANSQIRTKPCRSSFFSRGQEAHQQRALRDSTVFFALDWVDS